MANFSKYYDENPSNNQGLECLRVLNEIICDFDKILELRRFESIDKIKTIGSTYMAAIGLYPNFEFPTSNPSPEAGASNAQPERESQWHCNDQEPLITVADYMIKLVRFSLEMKRSLQDINKHSWNSFKLRIGLNLGPVTAGVIGASKPQYDIWGNTVNVASRMETTAELDKIQISDEVFQVMSRDERACKTFTFVCRGTIDVKGKGLMKTHYLEERRSENS